MAENANQSGSASLAPAPAEDMRRLLEVATLDILALDNGIARIRALVAVASAATKLLEATELETRLRVLEDALRLRWSDPARQTFAMAHDAEADSG